MYKILIKLHRIGKNTLKKKKNRIRKKKGGKKYIENKVID